MTLFHYLSWKPMDILSTFSKDTEPVMSVENHSIPPDLQRALLTGGERGFQLISGEAAKKVELYTIQSVLSM